jgi:hypothetical protein
MKQLALGVALLSLPFWLPATESEVYASEGRTIVLQSGDGKAVTVTASATAESEERGWLGVSIGEVPEALAAQIGTEEGHGLIILNVVKDSPAEKAGLRAHDVILAINGTAVESDAGKMAGLIRGKKPGELITLDVVQDGHRRNLAVALGDRPATFEWKWEMAPDAKFEEHVRTRGRMMTRDPSGKWIVKDLGDLHQLKNLPEQIQVMVQNAGNQSTQIQVDHNQVKVRVNRDGETIVVERSGDGPIRVERIDASGNSTTANYADEDELAAADPEAHELFAHVDTKVLHLNMDGMDREMIVKLAPGGEDFGQWQVQLNASLEEAREAFARTREELEEAKRQLEEAKRQLGLEWKGLFSTSGDGQGGPGKVLRMIGQPRQTFTVQPDGRIEVRIRKGDSEVVRVFQNENDLATREPALFEKYQDVMDEQE